MARIGTVVRAGLFPDSPKVGTGTTEVAENRKVVWWWNTKWMTVAERGFVDIEVPSFQIDRVLVAVGIVDSRSNAQRLIKSGAISWRKDDCKVWQDADGKWWKAPLDWEKVTDFRQELEAGWPWVLRVGDGHWRTVLVDVEVTEMPPLGATDQTPKKKKVAKPKSFNSLALVMRPEGPHQTKECWTELWD